MLLEDLTNRFEQVKKRNPLHANELLDYIQRSYIHGEISIVEYKNLFCELDKRGAKKPYAFFEKIETTDVEAAYPLSSTV